MSLHSQKLYKALESHLKQHLNSQLNTAIITLPGLGISYFLKAFIANYKTDPITYISQPGQTLASFNILDLNISSNPYSLEIINNYFINAKIDQKFALIIDAPQFVLSPRFKSSPISSHLYSFFTFPARDTTDTQLFAQELNPLLNSQQKSEIFKLSGGIAKLIKKLSLHPTLLNQDISIDSNTEISLLLQNLIATIPQCTPQQLQQLNITFSNKFISPILANYFSAHPIQPVISITLHPDLTFEESNYSSPSRLTPTEHQILEYLLTNNFFIPKEKISEAKWGTNSYDNFSDEAINKSMRRLNQKLTRHEIVTIPKTGFKLQATHG